MVAQKRAVLAFSGVRHQLHGMVVMYPKQDVHKYVVLIHMSPKEFLQVRVKYEVCQKSSRTEFAM